MHRFTTGDYLLRMTKDRTLLITSKRRKLQLKGKGAHTPYLGGLALILGRWRYSVNICCLNSGWGSFSKSKSHSSLGTMQAWFPMGEPIHGHGSCPPTSLPTGFPEGGLSHISHAGNGSPQWTTSSTQLSWAPSTFRKSPDPQPALLLTCQDKGPWCPQHFSLLLKEFCIPLPGALALEWWRAPVPLLSPARTLDSLSPVSPASMRHFPYHQSRPSCLSSLLSKSLGREDWNIWPHLKTLYFIRRWEGVSF